ncbi:MAG: hypothetical protein QMC85_05675 [Methanocellales archaeon]|nr:hypothetical protein [Methanocellales archaeon]
MRRVQTPDQRIEYLRGFGVICFSAVLNPERFVFHYAPDNIATVALK